MEYYILPIIFFVIAIVIWVLSRGILLRYFKIDEVLNELRKQNDTLAKINANLERTVPPTD